MPVEESPVETSLKEPSSILQSDGAVSGRITYNLHTLGWASFQNLCSTILREILSQTYQVFADSADAGRHGAFHGRWQPQGGEELSGSFVVQCKFTAKAGAVLQASQMAGEIEKVRKLGHRGLAQNYVLMTNASLRAPVEDELRKRFLALRGVKRFVAFDGNWITDQIRDNRRLRTLVPRVYGLGDLTEILDERVYEQAQAILSWLGDDLERFVVTDAHRRSIEALNDKRFVLLLGDPGSGKSTIAAALALAAADTWKSRVIKSQNAKDFTQHWNPNSDQFFWVDDAFGQTQYEREMALEWNYAIQPLKAALKKGTRVIFTSRSYIYRAAERDLKELLPILRDSQVVIEVEKLTRPEREQILYNHLRLGKQPSRFRRALKPFLQDFAAHENFLPETARRLGDPLFTKKVKLKRESVLHFVAEPEEYISDVIKGLSDAEQAALGLAFMGGGKLRAPLNLTDDETNALEVMNASKGEIRKAISDLEGSLMVREIEGGEAIYRFKHPTIRDAYGGLIGGDHNLMDIYLRGARSEVLIHEITCGEVDLEGVKLIVPNSRFPLVTERLLELFPEPGGRRRVASFLASRCSAEYLRHFLEVQPDFLPTVDPTSFPRPWLAYSDEVRLFDLLYSKNLLPESERERFVQLISNSVLIHPEWRFINTGELRNLFRPKEFSALRAVVRRKVTAARLQRYTESTKNNWKEAEGADPEYHFWEWEQELEAFSHEFHKNRMLYRRFRTARHKIDKIKQKLKKNWQKKQGDLETASESRETGTARSIFDDVDA
jgi:energy-coupling factor transporter ATP-binding protein EcfA2